MCVVHYGFGLIWICINTFGVYCKKIEPFVV